MKRKSLLKRMRAMKWERDNVATETMLSLVGYYVPREVIAELSDLDEFYLAYWAILVHLRASDNVVKVPMRPSFLAACWNYHEHSQQVPLPDWAWAKGEGNRRYRDEGRHPETERRGCSMISYG